MSDICTEKHRQVDKQFDVNEKRINNHSDRIDSLENSRASTDIEIRNLIEQIRSLVSTIKWMTTSTIITLAGFLIWYIQKLGA